MTLIAGYKRNSLMSYCIQNKVAWFPVLQMNNCHWRGQTFHIPPWLTHNGNIFKLIINVDILGFLVHGIPIVFWKNVQSQSIIKPFSFFKYLDVHCILHHVKLNFPKNSTQKQALTSGWTLKSLRFFTCSNYLNSHLSVTIDVGII